MFHNRLCQCGTIFLLLPLSNTMSEKTSIGAQKYLNKNIAVVSFHYLVKPMNKENTTELITHLRSTFYGRQSFKEIRNVNILVCSSVKANRFFSPYIQLLPVFHHGRPTLASSKHLIDKIHNNWRNKTIRLNQVYLTNASKKFIFI